MKKARLFFSCSLTIIVGVLACSKEVANQTNATDNKANSAGVWQPMNILANACNLFAYSDTIFYPALLPADYIVKPTTAQAGTYGAFPAGLAINSVNGNIDITKSETGLEYQIWFVAKGSTDTCKKFVTVSGINYADSIYVLANNTNNAAPVYNANLLTPADCSGGCEFDDGPDDDNGNGTADEPPAGQELIPKGFALDKSTGIIDLKKSLQNGVLGKNPKNGVFKDFVLNYRIGDKSAKALNHINFRLYYYKTQTQIPASLKNQLAAKQGEVLIEGEEGDDDNGHHGGHGSSLTLTTGPGITEKNGQGEVKCRPPYIIVTQQ